jgi:hypothetical protein
VLNLHHNFIAKAWPRDTCRTPGLASVGIVGIVGIGAGRTEVFG